MEFLQVLLGNSTARDVALLELDVPVLELDDAEDEESAEPENLSAGEVEGAPESLVVQSFLLGEGIFHDGAHYFAMAEVNQLLFRVLHSVSMVCRFFHTHLHL